MISNIDQIVKSDNLKTNLFNQLANHMKGDSIEEIIKVLSEETE